MEYYNSENKAPQIWATIITLLYLLVILVAFLFVKFDFDIEDKSSEGILVDFGSHTEGVQGNIPAIASTPPPPVSPTTVSKEEQLETDPNSDVAVEAAPDKKKQHKEVSPAPVDSKPTKEVEEKPQVVNKKALFPGNSNMTSAAQGGGSSAASSASGESAGDPNSKVSNTNFNDGISGVAFDLEGRSVVGSLPTPAYSADATGRVVIEVTVSDNGRVTSASYRAKGSTTNNSQLIAASVKAAYSTRFSESESVIQGGVITYTFRYKN